MSGPGPAGELAPDTRKLLSQVVLGAGALILFSLFAWILVPGLRREATEPKFRAGEQAPTPRGSGWLDAAEAPPRPAEQIPPVDPAMVLEPTPALLERGRALFAQNCAACHGPSGHGDGPAAAALNPKPRNFSQAAGWKNGSTRSGIYKTLEAGIPGTGMVAYDFLLPKDRMALVHLVRSMGSFDHGAEEPAAVKALSDAFASKGASIPARIPVSTAMAKLAAEAPAVPPLVMPAATDASPGSVLLRRAVADPARASRFLAGVPGWRSDAGVLATACAAGAPADGFRPVAATFAAGEWNDLQAALKAAGAP